MVGLVVAEGSTGRLGLYRKEVIMPKPYDPHAHQARNLAIGLVAFVCFIMVGVLALVG